MFYPSARTLTSEEKLTTLQDLQKWLFGTQQQKSQGRRALEGTQTRALAGYTTPKWKGIFENGTDLWRDADKQPYDAQAALSMPRHWEHVIGGQHNNSGEAYHIQYQADMMKQANLMLHVPNGA